MLNFDKLMRKHIGDEGGSANVMSYPKNIRKAVKVLFYDRFCILNRGEIYTQN